MSGRFLRRPFFDQFIAVTVSLFFCFLFTERRETSQEVWNFRLVPRFSQGLDEPVQCCLVLWILLQCLPALVRGLLVLSGFHIKLGQNSSSRGHGRLQDYSFLGRAQGQLKFWRTRLHSFVALSAG